MKINFPKIVRPIDLSEYAPEIKGSVFVWVNPSRQTLAELSEKFNALVESEGKEGLEPFLEMMAELLSQGEKDTHFSATELNELIEGTKETDPAFWPWLQGKVLELINEYRLGLKKD